ncbi:helix-turn-helix transcriptional regulator [Kaistia adipata]|nr:helix-turn-helix transcriptional regulator [Kaistia adipata]
MAGVATRLGLSPETVRAQIKAVFAKTGLSRQADLLALFARAPSLP